jgi:hypothetical protein
MACNPENLSDPKYLIPFIMTGEADEVATYFPTVKDECLALRDKIEKDYANLLAAWNIGKNIQDQKEFALAIKDKTTFGSILFNLRRKYGMNQTLEQLRQEWRNSEENIIKRYKK